MKLKRKTVSVGQSIGGYLQCCRIDGETDNTFYIMVVWCHCVATMSSWQQCFTQQALGSHAPIVPTKILGDPDELDRHLLQNGYPETFNPHTPVVDTYDNHFIFSQQDSEIELHVSCTEMWCVLPVRSWDVAIINWTAVNGNRVVLFEVFLLSGNADFLSLVKVLVLADGL